MKILLDTCTLLWAADDEARLSPTARYLLLDGRNDLLFSVVSVWEICVKYGQGRLQLDDPPDEFIRACRRAFKLVSLPLLEEAVFRVGKLKLHHNDPFDRMLICQAIFHDLAILSPDPALGKYPIRLIW